ncbi:unnamed protein product [Didymodactylos carnosus]|uniref:Uncharacterized protein n=1 Tax=Didymodactylos carnosus TaxID=1234261 RepID=A0A815G6I8_9BILA|nr:unnamed protein product [Didymodactylos carnosus]CAF1335073.1 unnamed protein product [Didymodactylos carnosus]CAF3724866.1 unnamed protein product [Didymodactylos carnosus]CAF4191628.1 unnamed protein product [Didymodactylos carnosus]
MFWRKESSVKLSNELHSSDKSQVYLVTELNKDEYRHRLDALDLMREILNEEKINLPEIVVAGDQSVGKSSVLEALSGIQLPRAQNICTRCPLELRLKNSMNDAEYATIRCKGEEEEKITDLDDISQYVKRLTQTLAGDGVNVSSDPIYLTVYKQNIPDLTLIDLPGITRNPLPGQSKDIYKQIITLIDKYIQPETAIVLHVIPASVDFTTSESVKISKNYDPEGKRQLIAVSKIDKFDKGIGEKLQGKGPGSMKLEFGCVAVLNRSPEEIEEEISFEEMKQREKAFFKKNHHAFHQVPEELLGSDQLVKKLADIQQDIIRSTFPKIIEEIKQKLREKKIELSALPVAITSELECWTKFNELTTLYRIAINTKVNGEYGNEPMNDLRTVNVFNFDEKESIYWENKLTLPSEQPPTKHVTDERIAYHFYKFQVDCQNKIQSCFADFFHPIYCEKVLKLLEETAGVSLPNFPSFQVISRLYQQEKYRLRTPCLELVKRSKEYLKTILIRLFDKVFTTVNYPRLSERLKDLILDHIDTAEEKCFERVNEMLDIEERVFTLNHYYMDTVNKIKLKQKKYEEDNEFPDGTNKNGQSDDAIYKIDNTKINFAEVSNEKMAAFDIQIAMFSYCKVVQKRVCDNVAQYCYYYFITKCALVIDTKLNTSCISADLFKLMIEPAEITKKRNKLEESIRKFAEALRVGQESM